MDIEIPEGDPVNYALGVQQCDGQEELFVNLLEKFAMGCDNTVSKIESAYQQRDIVVMRREAHSLKGSSAYVAALRVSKSAFRVQVACERIMDHQTNSVDQSGGSIDLNDVDPALLTALQETWDLLRKEHRLLRGYLRRNFAFLPGRSPSSTYDDRRDKSSATNNGCSLM
ncbi:hypothetical protein PINS_up009177 [Pythium insidiosum]|nr:hypothetical protein PINS_up009177 [Pythium insidiosum]